MASVSASCPQVHELAPDVEAVIRSIHSNKTKAVVYVTGGAVQASCISWLLAVPGASATVLEAAVPYARSSLISTLGKEPEQYCSSATAAAMAEAAYRRAADLSSFGDSIVGLGATCSLSTVGAKRGDHRAFLAVHGGSAAGSRCLAMTLAKGARTRVGEDDLVSRMLIKEAAAAAASAGCSTAAAQSAFVVHSYDVVNDIRQAANDPVQQLLRGEIRCVEFCGSEVVVDAPRHGRVYLPGSFNPLHQAALRAANGDVGVGSLEGAFELTVQNADKGLLSAEDIHKRVAQFVALGLPVVVTRAPLFTNKADLLPGSRFVVGYDTAARLVLPKYYGNSYTQMLLDFARLRQNGCSFIVAGRKDAASGRFMSLANVEVPPELADLFTNSLPEEAFRLDISSTELRLKAQLK
ncbi:hypothetical protein VOLCADRAFT_78735 [Volvox carteri f. nagariensis]|uniref:Uncharacterized protein n=1 Tax=Volvox carteri f. nagariensis TaxID=3068 RepID=D8THN1_VOLCA|nr:uncharacterized protein VOLCADRAFT_78735 [Volvox carteri f. nagariensis]EFJ52742.1 hypothetical protein VOLCADRAFT_78735 [Volvox carteri f. nagariensis]|eukprot:XP_002945747.1 hypothetical protein VOLCADRAFT_78735 [Volvox carteri f. nagariensis]